MNIKDIIEDHGDDSPNYELIKDLIGGISIQEAKEMGFLANLNDFATAADKEYERKIVKALRAVRHVPCEFQD